MVGEGVGSDPATGVISLEADFVVIERAEDDGWVGVGRPLPSMSER